MGNKNEIYWTDGWNPLKLISGGYYCDPVSVGCKNGDEITCWANDVNTRFHNGTKFGTLKNPEFVLNEKVLEQPLHWRKSRVIAVQWLGDLFHKDVPIRMIAGIFNIMACATLTCNHHHFKQHIEECWDGESHIFLVLTKRIGRAKQIIDELPSYVADNYLSCRPIRMAMEIGAWPLSNVYFGTTICTQAEADKNIPILLQIPATHRMLSVEPCLEGIDLNVPYGQGVGELALESGKIHQVILGGESGHGARPMCPDWPRRVRDDCAEAGVPFFFKQWGEWITPSGDFMEIGGDTGEPERYSSIHHWSLSPRDPEPIAYRVGKKKAGRLLDGKEHNQLAWRRDENEV